MNRYGAGEVIKLEVLFVDNNNNAVQPVSVKYTLTDKTEATLIPETEETPVAGTTSLLVTIPSDKNEVEVGVMTDYRLLTVSLICAEGTYIQKHQYLLDNNVKLIFMTNSYQTLGEAEILAEQLASRDNWASLEVNQKIYSMINSFNKLGQKAYLIDGVLYSSLNEATESEFNALSSNFINAIRLAQIAEANYNSGSNEMERLRRAGIFSYTIGETSQSFRPAPIIRDDLCDEAMGYINKYINKAIYIGRG